MSDRPTNDSWPWAIGVALLAVAAFVPVLNSGTFVNDDDSVLRIPLVSTWRNVPAIFSQEFMIHTEGRYRPLSYALLATVRTVVSADTTVFWHLWLASFHALNAVLVFLLADALARRRLASVAAGAVFALHPMSALFANHATAFYHVLGGTLALGTILAYVRFIKSGRTRAYILSILLLAAGLLTSKLVLAAPAMLVLYELLWVRRGLAGAAARLLPVLACCVLVMPCWLWLEPNPMHYAYPTFRPGAARHAFYTFLGRTPLHLRAVVCGVDFEAPLDERTTWITGIVSPAFPTVLLFGGLGAALCIVALVMMCRRRWIAFGILLAVLGAAPYASVAFHPARDYIAWRHLYFVLAGFALCVGALVDVGLSFKRSAWRVVTASAAAALVTLYAAVLVRANLRTRSPETYWNHVLTVNPQSATASVALGKRLLERDEVDGALERLFNANVNNTLESGFAMVLHYIEDNEPMAAAIQFNSAVAWQPREFHTRNRVQMVGARLVYTAKVFDYVEQAMAQFLMTDPHDTAGLRLMAEVLASKGRVRAACMLLAEAGRIDPGDARTTRLLARIEERLYSTPVKPPPRIAAADYDWLVYVMKGTMTSRLRKEVLVLAERFPSDPVIQLAAGECLLDARRPDLARPKLLAAVARMPAHPTARALASRVPDESGVGPAFLVDRGLLFFEQHRLAEAEASFREAVRADDRFTAARANLAQVLALQEKHDLALEQFRKVLALTPHEPQAHMDLAAFFLGRGDCAACIRTLEAGLAVTAAAPALKLRLAWVLATAPEASLRDGKRALAIALSVGTPEIATDVEHLDVLAAAYAENGDFDRAVAAARKAADLARRDDAKLSKEIEERRGHYERKQPYRTTAPGARR